MSNEPTMITREGHIEALVTQRSDGRWAWEVLIDGNRYAWVQIGPSMPAYRASAFGHCRREAAARRKARKHARKAAKRIAAIRGRELIESTQTLVDWQ